MTQSFDMFQSCSHLREGKISAGDFNGGVDIKCYCQRFFAEFPFKDLLSAPTYENKQQLDHVYVSDAFQSSRLSVEGEILDSLYMQYTDHSPVAITIKKAS